MQSINETAVANFVFLIPWKLMYAIINRFLFALLIKKGYI